MINRRQYVTGLGAAAVLAACSKEAGTSPNSNPNPALHAFDPRFFDYIAPNAEWSVLSSGHQWLEGPAWDSKRQKLYFTDVPQNVAYTWSQKDGVSVFLKPSGADLSEKDGFREPGANGLWYEADTDSLIICNHGRRSVQRMDLQTNEAVDLTHQFEGKKFNSPNDVVKAKDGTLFFTDPPYGLKDLDASPLKEMAHNGVYKLSPNGEVTRLLDDMTFPNGVVLSPDEGHLYISQSDPEAAIVRRLTLSNEFTPTNDEIWFDASQYQNEDMPGLPDGMTVCADGSVFVTGPGGVFLISADGTALGRITTGRANANCVFGEDGQSLFITAGHSLIKLPTLCRGLAT
ncbi:SMP-30/gluconolactonase/LRE family protein [Hirschia maritima]|uniref:SMP-30/gluconolactonase/LRE family protein n=1 Tax=Hirschia maritima TaxID=1121961 RepID=UPI0003722589|nr:SMP-30/gluconolactonase/LRE family protein [Hirschia maritima]